MTEFNIPSNLDLNNEYAVNNYVLTVCPGLKGAVPLICQLDKLGANVGKTLEDCGKYNSVEVFELLVERGDSSYCDKIIINAAKEGHLDMLKYCCKRSKELLDATIDQLGKGRVMWFPTYDHSAVYTAIRYGHLHIAQWYIEERKVLEMARNDYGRLQDKYWELDEHFDISLLSVASTYLHAPIVKYLLETIPLLEDKAIVMLMKYKVNKKDSYITHDLKRCWDLIKDDYLKMFGHISGLDESIYVDLYKRYRDTVDLLFVPSCWKRKLAMKKLEKMK
jgi:hypothetical protein